MSKIRYPDKKEIRRQTSIIIDRSGIFDSFEPAFQYKECKPVRKKRKWIAKTAGAVFALAALCLFVLLSGHMIRTAAVRRAALTSVGSDDTLGAKQPVDTSKRMEVIFNQQTVYTNCENDNGSVVTMVKNELKLPEVYRYGTVVEPVTTYYMQRWQSLSTRLGFDAMNELEYTVRDLAFEAESPERQIAFEENESGVLFKYECSQVPDVYYLENKPDLVSFYENYSASYSAREDSGVITNYKISRVYGGSFDASTGEPITLSDVFTNPEAGRLELAQAVFAQVRQRHGNEALETEYTSVENVLKSLNETTGWYFGKDGIVVCCNRVTNVSPISMSKEIRYRVENSETYTVPYDDLSYLIP